MSISPLKMVSSFLQKRTLQTKPPKPKSSKPPKPCSTKKARPKITPLLPLEERAKSVITLLRTQHFSETQITKLIERYPRILKSKVTSNLEPKFKFLNQNGFKGPDLPNLIMSNPMILNRSLTAHLIPTFEFLRARLGKNKEGSLQIAIKRASRMLTVNLEKFVYPNISLLESEGMPKSSVVKLFVSHPRSLFCSTSKVLSVVGMVRKFGIRTDDTKFVHVFRVFKSMSESNFKKKIEVLKSLGWSDDDIATTIVSQPLCLSCSEEKLRRGMEFFVNVMKVEPKTVVSDPKLVMYSFKKRVVPRCSVLMILLEKKLLEKRSLSGIMNMSEEEFVRKYVLKYIGRVPNLLDVYHGKSMMGSVVGKL